MIEYLPVDLLKKKYFLFDLPLPAVGVSHVISSMTDTEIIKKLGASILGKEICRSPFFTLLFGGLSRGFLKSRDIKNTPLSQTTDLQK
jgi:hypothetical protein